ncbi:hypothetical protein A2U01_0042731, partial [Trifolium medium]|nr:hypothetical protein [Trifolium medium]
QPPKVFAKGDYQVLPYLKGSLKGLCQRRLSSLAICKRQPQRSLPKATTKVLLRSSSSLGTQRESLQDLHLHERLKERLAINDLHLHWRLKESLAMIFIFIGDFMGDSKRVLP